jgi:hypothetical protein
MKQHLHTILLGGALAAALGACSSTSTQPQPASSIPATSGSSGAAGTTSSGSDTDTHGNNTRLTPPPVASPTSTGGVIDDRINEKNDVPGQNH